jgi:hypothetical protein
VQLWRSASKCLSRELCPFQLIGDSRMEKKCSLGMCEVCSAREVTEQSCTVGKNALQVQTREEETWTCDCIKRDHSLMEEGRE